MVVSLILLLGELRLRKINKLAQTNTEWVV